MRLGRKFKTFAFMLVFTMLLSNAAFAQATETRSFSDVPSNHWAHNAISLMVERQIISGYSDNTFKPDNPISREEFAKIMVLALGLPIKNPQTESFRDVSKEDWAYKYVESAKNYLTGFRTVSGDLFKPSSLAVREDMAVALVKAMGYSNDTVDEGNLNTFIDKDGISSNLKKFVAIAVKRGIMQGSALANSNSKAFNPQGVLTRAEAAMLLYNVINKSEEKITYGEGSNTNEQTQLEDEDSSIPYAIPNVTGSVQNGKVIIKWQAVNDSRFKYYKVVVSADNPYPRYPEDGYLYVITDKNTTQAVIDNSTAYNSGDFGDYLTPGKQYYFSVTAVYEDIKLPGNAVRLTYPGRAETSSDSDYAKPQVKAEVLNGKIGISWNEISGRGFNYYKVVVSKNNSSPRYPDDGYLTYITDQSQTSWVAQAGDGYNGGDFGGKLLSGETYYFSVTAVFGDRKLVGNAVRLKVP